MANNTKHTKRVRDCLLHYNAINPYCSCKDETFGKIGIGYSICTVLAPSDYKLFTKLKEALGGKTFDDDGEVEEYIYTTWLHDMAANFKDFVITLSNHVHKMS